MEETKEVKGVNIGKYMSVGSNLLVFRRKEDQPGMITELKVLRVSPNSVFVEIKWILFNHEVQVRWVMKEWMNNDNFEVLAVLE